MSMDKTLKGGNTLERHRNVLTRAERIEYLKETGRWMDDASPIGLPKVAHRKAAVGKKAKAKKEVDEATAEKEGATGTTEQKS